jgi:hypothetical protein
MGAALAAPARSVGLCFRIDFRRCTIAREAFGEPVRRSTPMTQRAARKQPPVRPSAPPVAVEYPQDGELVVSPVYTLRLGAKPGVESIEVSIDGGPWQACRPSVGHWWYDWSGYGDGAHTIEARGELGGGVRASSAPRRVTVERVL